MPTKKAVKKTVKAKKTPTYEVILNYNDKEVVLTGDDLTQIFNDFEPEIFKSRVNVKVKKGKRVIERLWPVMKARRVFRNFNNAVIEAGLINKFLVE